MKIKRFLAPDIRQAMRMVREEQGPEAVILSNKRGDGGVEIVAAVDYDESMLPGYVPAAPASRDGIRTATSTPIEKPASIAAARADTSAWTREPVLLEMRAELNNLRRMFESQLSSLAWGAFARGNPRRVELIQRLMQFGLTAAQCKVIAEAADGADGDLDEMWRRSLDLIARRLPLYDRDLLNDGGVVALVGPTGVGKTTTVAKLAARYAQRHGNRNVALVTIDNYRVGAYEQLRTYGRILDIPVKKADGGNELRVVLDDLADRRLVLIDTTGMGQRDSGLARQAAILDQCGRDKKVFLLLSAASRCSGLEDVVTAFDVFKPDGCMVTKIDETTCLGGALSVTIKHRMPIVYVSDGQRVPEDLHVARADTLMASAVEVMNRTGALINEDLIAPGFEKELANAHV